MIILLKIPVTSLVNDINHINKLLKVPGAKTSKKPVKKPKKLVLVKSHSASPKPPASKTKKKRELDAQMEHGKIKILSSMCSKIIIIILFYIELCL